MQHKQPPRAAEPTATAWHLADEFPRYPRDLDLSTAKVTIVKIPPVKPVHSARWTPDFLAATAHYLSTRQWCSSGKITWIELILDMVIEIRMFPIGLGTTSTVAELSESMLRLWQFLAGTGNHELAALPRTVLVYSLHALGMRRGSGLEVRCQISECTQRVLRHTVLSQPTVIDKGWKWVPSWTPASLERFALVPTIADADKLPGSAASASGAGAM